MLLSSFCTFYFVHNNVSAMIIIGTFYLKLFLSIDPATKISRIIMINAALDGEDNIKVVEDFKKIISEIEKFENQLK